MIAWKPATQNADVASFRFRVEAPLKAIRSLSHETELFREDHVDAYSAVVFSKAYSKSDLKLAERIANRGGRVIFDICDNHFYNPEALEKYKRAHADILAMMQVSQTVTCSTQSLARIIGDLTHNSVTPIVIEDMVEKLAINRPTLREGGALNLLWFGSHGSPNAPGGMGDLALIQAPLKRLAEKMPITVTVCSNNRDKYEQLIEPLGLPTCYTAWSAQTHLTELARAHAVLLPINRNPFTECKSHNRLTSALYAGVPVVASGIDSYVDLSPYCSLDAWDEGLNVIAEDFEAESRRALSSRPLIDARWSEAALAPQWAEALGADSTVTAARMPSVRRSASPSSATFQGRLDAVAIQAVTGWVRNILRPDERLEVVLELDGEEVAAAKADLPREDLLSLGFSHPHCGFSLSLKDISVSDPSQLTVKVAGSGWRIDEAPLLVSEPIADAETLSQPFAQTPPVQAPQTQESVTRFAAAPRTAAAAQGALQDQLDSVEGVLSEVRRVLSRAVLALGDAPVEADRLRRLLSNGTPEGAAQNAPNDAGPAKGSR